MNGRGHHSDPAQFQGFQSFMGIACNTIRRQPNAYIWIPMTQVIESSGKNFFFWWQWVSQTGRLLYWTVSQDVENTVEWIFCNSKLLTKEVSWYCYVVVVRIKPRVYRTENWPGISWWWSSYWSSYCSSTSISSSNHGRSKTREIFVCPSFVNQAKYIL